MRVIILTILIFFSPKSFSQDSGFGKVGKYVDGLNLHSTVSLNYLVETLTKSFNSPTLKTCAIYYWIAKNIEVTYQHELEKYFGIDTFLTFGAIVLASERTNEPKV